jgi:hypothetical protein
MKMTKLLFSVLLLAAGFSAAPVYAAPANGDTIGRGCTLDPFTHTQRCIDFDHCTINKQGQKVCPVVVTTTRLSLF